MTKPSNAQTVWAELLVDALASSGVVDVVLSPGSRSTPLVLALEAEPRIRVHDVIDERAAGFVALGMARASGEPSVLVCTSGSAPAHYFPAVVEAEAAGLPLIVLSADRPFSLQRAGESQTIDQTKLFGDRVRLFVDLGEPGASATELRAMRRMIAQAVHSTRHPLPGPVHLDARFVKPLEPGVETDAAAEAHAALGRSLRAAGTPRLELPRSLAGEEAIDRLADRLAAAERPWIVVGPAHRRSDSVATALAALVDATGIPAFVDPTSNLRFGPHGGAFCGALDALLRSERVRRELRPDLILQVGRAPIASGHARLLTEHAIDVALVDEHAYLDPWSRASSLVLGDRAATLAALATACARRELRRDARWAATVRRLDRAAFEEAARIAEVGERCTEAGLARAVIAGLPEGARLVVGNSLAVREVDGWVPPGERAIEVLSQRGASGIDGLIAGLVGAQLARPRPTVLLVGDVSFAHDVGSLALLRRLAVPTVVVAVDNGGGRIFDQLPIAERAPAAMARFTTPPELAIAAIGAAFGLASSRIERRAELDDALHAALRRGSATLLHVVVEGEGALVDNRRLWRAVDAAVEAS